MSLLADPFMYSFGEIPLKPKGEYSKHNILKVKEISIFIYKFCVFNKNIFGKRIYRFKEMYYS